MHTGDTGISSDKHNKRFYKEAALAYSTFKFTEISMESLLKFLEEFGA